MDIVVHGTKGGCKIFTPQKISGLLDVTADGAKVTGIGQQAYGIRFTAGNTIFSKYKIIRDVRGDKRTGFVGFSLSIPNNKKLSGKEILTVLDKVSDEYSQTYIVDNNLNEVTENWTFLNNISDEYNGKLRNISADDVENMQSGDKDDAFVYCNSDELQKYFDAPYQEEYTLYRQILFISSDLKDKPKNPLNALRHSEKDLTGKIDLDNPSYTLSIIGNGFNVQPRNKIRKKQTLTITYDKQKFYKTPDTIKGTWNNIKQNHPNCIEVDDERKTVTIKQIDLQPECKRILITVKDNKGNLLNGAEIIMESNNKQYTKTTNINECTFEGDEIGQTWYISAKIEKENLFSGEVSITPDEQNDALKLRLKKRKIVNIEAVDENGQQINSFEYWINDKNGYRQGGQHVFEGDDIEKNWNIEARAEGCSSDTVKYCPATGNNLLRITLKKRQKSDKYKFSFKGGKNGKICDNNKSSPYTGDNIPSCLKELINKNQDCKVKKLHSSNFEITAKPNFGYKFDRWEKQKKNDEYTITAQFKPMIIEGIIASLILIAIVFMAVSFWDNIFSGQSSKSQQQTISAQQITDYVEGDALLVDTLNSYQDNWKCQESNYIRRSGDGFGYKLTHIFVGEETADSTKWRSDWQPVYESIEQAITIRTKIDEKKFLELKYGNFEWSTIQKNFKDAINKIDSVNSAEVRKKLGDVSSFTLTQIADSINSIIETTTQSNQQNQNSLLQNNTTNSNNTTTNNQNNSSVQNNSNNSINNNSSNTSSASTSSGRNAEQQQEKFQNEFWALVHKSESPSKKDFDDWFNTGSSISAQNEYKKFYNDYLSTTQNFQRLNDFFKKPVIDRKKVKQLKELKNKLQ